jgi:hypothetical protein
VLRRPDLNGEAGAEQVGEAASLDRLRSLRKVAFFVGMSFPRIGDRSW